MPFIPPKPVFIGEYKIPLNTPRRPIWKKIPIGGVFILDYFLAEYPIDIDREVGAVQWSPDLSFQISDTLGNMFSVSPVLINQVTAPGGLGVIGATQPLNFKYPAGSDILISIEGWIPNFPIPWVSVTLMGRQGFGLYGMGG